ncbi:MAG TPA: class I SAM-dependent methyltransferase [Anaerolineaceae bacterium]|nr:class I SAM-dependent methyltransferase [Anaerolineaceae bacterium]
MDSATAARLVEINRQFYESFSQEFSATRARIQPGVQRILGNLKLDEQILDLGSGNGELAAALLRLGFRGRYLGLDFSPSLVEEARRRTSSGGEPRAAFIQADLTSSTWAEDLPHPMFQCVLLFAVLHHIPDGTNRARILRQVSGLLHPGGKLFLSVWQFLNSPRWQKRILPWKTVGLDDCELDPGDTLLDWRAGGNGIRYVHHFSYEELQDLADRTGYFIAESFSADGKEGNLGLYQVWGRNP